MLTKLPSLAALAALEEAVRKAAREGYVTADGVRVMVPWQALEAIYGPGISKGTRRRDL